MQSSHRKVPGPGTEPTTTIAHNCSANVIIKYRKLKAFSDVLCSAVLLSSLCVTLSAPPLPPRYTLTEGDFHHLKNARLTHLHIPPPALNIVTIHECEGAENSIPMTTRPVAKSSLSIFQVTALCARRRPRRVCVVSLHRGQLGRRSPRGVVAGASERAAWTRNSRIL